MRKVMTKNQKIFIQETKPPDIKATNLVIKTLYSVISPGTELMIIRESGNELLSLGYSASGIVEEVGEKVQGFKKGDIVACYGAPFVSHAEYLSVPHTLCAKVPESVSVQEASLVGIGAIAIHSLRVADLSFGETAVVLGLGLFGQFIAKIANTSAFQVIAFDIHEERARMLREEANLFSTANLLDMEKEISHVTNDLGADAIFLCYGGPSTDITGKSLTWLRDRGKIVIVGDVEPNFPRENLFHKEAQIRIARAGGPGRYDAVYENKGIDYPYGYVRWTQGRNMEFYLRLLAQNRIQVNEFIDEVITLEEIEQAYDHLVHKESSSLTKLIDYQN